MVASFSQVAKLIGEMSARIEALEKRQGYSGQTPSMGNWHDFPLESNWSDFLDYQPMQYAIDNSGMVHIRGVAQKSGGTDYMGQLPTGYRPNKQHRLLASGADVSATYVEIDKNGIVMANSNTTVDVVGLTTVFPVNDGLRGNPMPLNNEWFPYYEVGQDQKWGWPYLHKHASGAMVASGTIRGGSQTLLEIAAFLDTDQSNEFAHIMRGLGTTSVGDTPIISRFDASPGKITWVAGGAPDSASVSGWVWPSNTHDTVESEELDLVGNPYLTQYAAPTGTSWHPHPKVSKDKSGWCIMSGIGTNYSIPSGTTIATITSATMRPPAKLLLPLTYSNLDKTTPVALNTNGTFVLVQSIPAYSYVSFDGLHFHTT